ncbi:MAG: low molecular weight protein arginine phosphatase [Verrucomicrobiota bacterium]
MGEGQNLVVVICTGNVCRSPMAELLLQHALNAEEGPASQLNVVSAGVACGYGEAASNNSVTALKRVGLDLSRHMSQPVTQSLLDNAFAVLGMTNSHLDILQHYYPKLPTRTHLFREFMEDQTYPEIPDPFGQDLDAYLETRDAMIEAIPLLVAYLKREASA